MKRHGGPAGPAPGGAKKSKGPEDDGTPKPAYSVIQATNPISALYEYCRKSKLLLKLLDIERFIDYWQSIEREK